MNKKNEVKGDSNIDQKSSILGTFEGECADSNITNKNGLDITREVWETVFASDEYKEALKLGHYIGFLGHPEDPNCMDFEHACIVMREGHVADDGKIYGSFDLIDTPVGKIVKAFQDAGVQFGISVRGAGDIIDNSVDPDTFVFRGFDLVSFPAYPNAIPKFTEIAASSDVETQKKYKTICAAVRDNIDSLTTCDAVDVIQSQFAKQSEEYELLEKKKDDIKSASNSNNAEEYEGIYAEKIEGLTQLYISANSKINDLKKENEQLKASIQSLVGTTDRKLKSFKRIYDNQVTASEKIKSDNAVKLDESNKLNEAANKELNRYKRLYSNQQIKFKNLQQENLKYKQRVESADKTIEQKDSIISDLESRVEETVTSSRKLNKKASNLDVKVHNLEAKIEACQQIIQDYQDAYGNMYANALGVHIDDLSINASTSVSELQAAINGAVSRGSISVDAKLPESSEDILIDSIESDDIVTL